jgi:hypothetical protein
MELELGNGTGFLYSSGCSPEKVTSARHNTPVTCLTCDSRVQQVFKAFSRLLQRFTHQAMAVHAHMQGINTVTHSLIKNISVIARSLMQTFTTVTQSLTHS